MGSKWEKGHLSFLQYKDSESLMKYLAAWRWLQNCFSYNKLKVFSLVWDKFPSHLLSCGLYCLYLMGYRTSPKPCRIRGVLHSAWRSETSRVPWASSDSNGLSDKLAPSQPRVKLSCTFFPGEGKRMEAKITLVNTSFVKTNPESHISTAWLSLTSWVLIN